MPELSYYTCILIIAWLSLVVMHILVHENDRIDRKTKNVYHIVYSIVGFSALFEWMGVFLNGNMDFPIWALQFVKTCDYILAPFAAIAMLAQARHQKTFRRVVITILIFNTVFQIVTAFTGGMLIIDKHHQYSHGPLYPIYMVTYLVLSALIIVGFFIYSKRFRKQNKLSLYSIMVFIIVGILIQELTDTEVRTAYLTLAIAMPLLYIHVNEFSQIKRDDELKQKNYEIMVSQIKPHFLFNSLAVIREIYQEDLEAGDQAITDFSQFLRYNIDSLSKERLTSFSDEIENVKRYLELQQLRFGDDLSVSYDLECMDFKVPTLSIQPIVENAVSHGVRKRKDHAGLVTITSKEFPDRYEVSIIDNGPGFDPDKVPKYTDRSHIGIENVRERLALSEHGELRIDSVIGQGTTATLVFPKGAIE